MSLNSYPKPHELLGKGDLITDAWGVQKVSLPYSIFHGMWTFDIPPAMWFMLENGSEVSTSTDITSVGGMAKLLTTGTNAALWLCSRVEPRYQPNRGHLFSTALLLPSKTNDGVRDFGLFTEDNGVYFRLKADGLLYAVRLTGGVEVQEEVIDTSGLTSFDVEKSNTYDIQFQWRSAGDYKFYIGDPSTGQSKLVHTFNLLGTLTSASLEDPALPISYKATRLTQDVEIRVGCADITSENGRPDTLQYEAARSKDVSTNGSDKPLLVIYNPLLIDGKTNTRTLEMARVTVSSSKKGNFTVWTTRDPAAITGETLVQINNGTYVETDSPDMVAGGGAVRATAVTVSGLKFLAGGSIQANTTESIDNPIPQRISFSIVRGDYIVVTLDAVNATSDCIIVWGEAI